MALRPIEILINAKDNASAVFDGLKAKVMAVGAIILSYFGIQAFGGMIKGAADFEQALSRVQAATGATKDEMVLLRKAAEDSGVDSIQAAGALENLAKAGLSAKEAIGTLPAAIALAQAGDVSLAESSEYLTKIVMGMGLSFADAGRVADVLALGANATNTSVKGLAEGLSYAAPLAQSLGLSLESTVAIMGKFADAGIDSSRAGTALNSIMAQFGDPASKFRAELGAAGITTNNFEEALHQLAAVGPRGAKAINAVGQEAGPALRALLNQGMPALDELTRKLRSAEGSAADAAKVMQGNLNGALSDLQVAWKYVTDTLSTPVLPVLRDGVVQLSGVLRQAAADGTVTKFGQAIAAAFQSGIKWVRDFIAQVNFTQVTADMRAFADRTGEVFTQIGEYASTAGNTVKLVYGTMSAGTNTVLGGVYLIGEAFAGVASNIQSGLAQLYEGLAKITFGQLSAAYKQAAEEVKLSAGATWAAAEELGAKSQAAFERAAQGAQLARDGFAGLSAAANGAAPAVSASAQAIGEMAKQLEAVAEKNAAVRQETEAKKAADEAAVVALRQLREEYQALVEKGDLQGAAEKLQEINRAMQDTPAASKDAIKAAQEAAQAIADAFQRLGITSSADLKLQADNALRDYKIIKGAGTSTASDIANAFKKSAEAAIAANDGVAPSWVTAEAAARGYEVQVDSAGKATLRAAEAGAASVDALARSYDNAGRAAKRAADIAEAARKKEEAQSGLKRTGGYENQLPVDKAFAIREKVQRGTLSADDLEDVETALQQAQDLKQYVDAYTALAPSMVSSELTQDANAMLVAAQTAYQRVRAMAQARSVTPDAAPVPASTSAPVAPALVPAAVPASYVTNITIGGQQRTVRVADAASSATLNDLIRDLADARGTAQGNS